MMIRRSLVLLSVALCQGAASAEGGGAVFKDRERSEPSLAGSEAGLVAPFGDAQAFRPNRPTNRSPGYVGSDFGLGRPAYTGLGSRPDWGRSSE